MLNELGAFFESIGDSDWIRGLVHLCQEFEDQLAREERGAKSMVCSFFFHCFMERLMFHLVRV
jgi:hypothetical protein